MRFHHGMARVTFRALLACAPPVLLCAICLLLRTFLLARFLGESATESRSTEPWYSAPTIHTHLFYPLRPIFEAGINHSAGLLIVGELFFLLFVFALLAGVESCRIRARLSLKYASFHQIQLLAAAFTSCMAFCIVFLPMYLFRGGKVDRRAQSAERNRFRSRMIEVWPEVCFYFLEPSMVALTCAVNKNTSGKLEVLVASTALALYFVNISLEYTPPGSATGIEEVAGFRYRIVIAFTLLWRLLTLRLLFKDPSLLSQVLTILSGRAGFGTSEIALLFFLIDLIGLTLCISYFALLEDGWVVGLCTLVGALTVLGPAPTLAVYCAYRERKIAESMVPDWNPGRVAATAA